MLEKVAIPESSKGIWSVSTFEVSEADAKAIKGRGYVPAGKYTQLKRGGKIVMSDTPDEMRDHRIAVRMATGHVLINGLGIGMVLKAVLKNPKVTAVTVIEASEDVIALVSPHYSDARLTIVHADAFAYQPPKGVRYGAVWHDIWDDICGDNIPQMTKLKRKYGRRADWQGCWCEYECRRYAR